MKGFQKLALTAAIAALPAAGFAMQPMADEELGDVTGQDGITIGLDLNQTMNILIDDTDGLDTGTGPSGYTAGNSGGIYIAGMGTAGSATIDIEAGGIGTEGVLVVAVELANGFTVTTGALSAVNTSGGGAFDAPTEVILESTDITFTNGLNLEIQLGDAAETFMELTGDAGSISFGESGNASSNFTLNDLANTGNLSADVLTIGGLDLTGTEVALVADDGLGDTGGLRITTGAGLNEVSITMESLALGNGVSMGDVYITGLNMAAQTITISGK